LNTSIEHWSRFAAELTHFITRAEIASQPNHAATADIVGMLGRAL
jgi:hypothetical protein